MLVQSGDIPLITDFSEPACSPALPKKQHPILRLNSICPYYTMFPLEFPYNALGSANKGDWVLDPFCGRGTTNYAARLRGIPSIGLDANPVAAAVSRSKFIKIKPEGIIKACRSILDENRDPESIPEGEFWDLCYHPKTLRQITQIREALLDNCHSRGRTALLAIMLGILHGPRTKGQPSYLSNQMPRTYSTKPGPAIKFWKKRGDCPAYVNVLDLVQRRTTYVYSDTPPAVNGGAYCFDSRRKFSKIGSRKFQWVITSPPYYAMRSYVPDQWLRYWFVGGPSDVAYDHERLIRHTSLNDFIADLARVWKNVAFVCDSGAHMVIRFGTLPSREVEPASIITESIQRADCGWHISSITPAGNAGKGKRQSDQFLQETSNPCEEIDLHAVLER